MDLSIVDRENARRLSPSKVTFTRMIIAARDPTYAKYLNTYSAKIQLAFREHLRRKASNSLITEEKEQEAIKAERELCAATMITKHCRGLSARRAFKRERISNASKHIQNLTRHLIARHDLEKLKEPRAAAATMISKHCRRFFARQELAKLRQQTQFTNTIRDIQVLCKSFLAKKRHATLHQKRAQRQVSIISATTSFKKATIMAAKASSALSPCEKIMLSRLYASGMPFSYKCIRELSNPMVRLLAGAKKACLSCLDFRDIMLRSSQTEQTGILCVDRLARFALNIPIDLKDAESETALAEVRNTIDTIHLLIERIGACVSHLQEMNRCSTPSKFKGYPVIAVLKRGRKKGKPKPRYPATTTWCELPIVFHKEATNVLKKYAKQLSTNTTNLKGITISILDQYLAFQKMVFPNMQCDITLGARCALWRADLQPGSLYSRIIPAVAKAMIETGSYSAFALKWVEIYKSKATHPLGILISKELGKLRSYHMSVIATLFSRFEKVASHANFDPKLRTRDTCLEDTIAEAIKAGCLSNWSRIAPLTQVVRTAHEIDRKEIDSLIDARDEKALFGCLLRVTRNTPPSNTMELVEECWDRESPYVELLGKMFCFHRPFVSEALAVSRAFSVVHATLRSLFNERNRLQAL